MFEFALEYCWLIPLLPLLGAAIVGLTGAQSLKGNSHWPIWLTVGASAVLSIVLLVGMIGASPNAQLGAASGLGSLTSIPATPRQAAPLSRTPPAAERRAEGAVTTAPVVPAETPKSEGHHDPAEKGYGPDGRVKAWLPFWRTWFVAGTATHGDVLETGLSRPPVPTRPPGPNDPPVRDQRRSVASK